MRLKLDVAVGLAAVATAVVACATTDSTSAATHPMVRRRVTHIQNATAREDRSRCDATLPGRTASEYDTNGDGVPDVRKVYLTIGEGTLAHSVLVCREVDLNHDGAKDMFRFYDNEGRILRDEEDHDFDGRIDTVTYFTNGEVVRRELDTNGDGWVDMRVYYDHGRPYRAERELTSDHDPEFHPDYWEFYNPAGHVVRIGWDYDHDGRADRWDRVDRVSPLRADAASTLAAMGAHGAGDATAPPAAPGTAATPGAAGTPGATPSRAPGTPGTPAPAPTAGQGATTAPTTTRPATATATTPPARSSPAH